MRVMILAHGGHVAMFLMPVAAAIYLFIALRGDAKKAKNAGTPVLPTSSFSRQVHHAMSPQKAKKATTAPIPSRFAPGGPAKKRGRGSVVPLHAAPPPDQGRDSSSLPSAWNQ